MPIARSINTESHAYNFIGIKDFNGADEISGASVPREPVGVDNVFILFF